MHQVGVLIIDDSAFMRKMISEILSSDSRIKVLDTARNGEIGLKKIEKHNPDVVTLDVEMPVMDGMTTLKKIMDSHPLPVIMLSNVTGLGANKTMEAITNGAVDFVTKPSGAISLDIGKVKDELITKVLTAAQAKHKGTSSKVINKTVPTPNQSLNFSKSVIVIGTSTGGPRALQRVLSDIPKGNVPPILIVQHMPEKFTKSLAKRLNTLTHIEVREAVHGEIISRGKAYIAPGNQHMKLRAVGMTYAIELTQEMPVNGHRPSVDVLFESVSHLNKINKLAIVLTGMGNDGSKGLTLLKKKDPQTITVAESGESAVINGMPKAAIHTGCVNSIIHLHQIGSFIGNTFNLAGEM